MCVAKQTQTKKIHERPWIGGTFDQVATPASVRTNSQRFAKKGALVTRVHGDTPLAKAGFQEGDLALAVNGKNVRSNRDIQKVVDQAGSGPLTFTVYRAGEISEKTVTPGVERFEKRNTITFAIAFSPHFEVDLYPNPDFSLVALGYDSKRDRLDLRDPKATHQKELQQKERTSSDWEGLPSDEGWKAWLGPFWLAQNKMIVSQETAR